jgi:hypothetical protein
MDKKPGYKLMKVFDSQWNDPVMPDDVKDGFFRLYRDRHISNDVLVEYSIHDEVYEPGDENSQHAEDKNRLDAWLIKNGAEPPPDNDSEGETVLIKHWW